MNYDIVLTENAEEDLEAFVSFILHEKQNPQAARSILDDFDQTTDILSRTAGRLKLCDNPRLRALGYHRINFMSHRYFMLYRIEGNTVYKAKQQSTTSIGAAVPHGRG